MRANDNHFVTQWRVSSSIEQVTDVLGDPLDLVDWRPSVYLSVKEVEPKASSCLPTAPAIDPDECAMRRAAAMHVILKLGGWTTASLNWSQCRAVESVAGKRSGAWVFKDTRMPVSTVFENFRSGATSDQIMEWFDVTREEVVAMLEFAARSLDAPTAADTRPLSPIDAHSF